MVEDRKDVSAMIPIHGARPVSARSYRRRPGAYAILPLDGRVLLTFQRSPVPELQLPGGGLDPGEPPLRALHREVREETGWTIGAARLVGRYRQYGYIPEYDLWAEKLCSVYLARPIRRVSRPLQAEHQVVWATPAEAIERLTNAGDRVVVRDVLAAAI